MQHHREVDDPHTLRVGQNIVNKFLVDDAIWKPSMVVLPQSHKESVTEGSRKMVHNLTETVFVEET